jgi:hypothetical protein
MRPQEVQMIRKVGKPFVFVRMLWHHHIKEDFVQVNHTSLLSTHPSQPGLCSELVERGVSLQKVHVELGVVVHTCKPSTWELRQKILSLRSV